MVRIGVRVKIRRVAAAFRLLSADRRIVAERPMYCGRTVVEFVRNLINLVKT